MTHFASKHRIRVSQVVITSLILVILFSDHSWSDNNLLDPTFEIIGYILTGIGIIGRFWTSMYVSGYKDDMLITVGPYSVVRHPLYFFSFLGTLGIALVSKNIIVMIALPAIFLLYYPFVMVEEETRLLESYGVDYAKYKKTTPVFFPNFSLLVEPETYPVKARVFRKSFFDLMWFFWFLIILQIIERLHMVRILPVLFKIP